MIEQHAASPTDFSEEDIVKHALTFLFAGTFFVTIFHFHFSFFIFHYHFSSLQDMIPPRTF